MPPLPTATPEQLGFDAARLRRAHELISRWVADDRVPAAALCVGRRDRMLTPFYAGRLRPGNDAPRVGDDTLFLVASITKPVTSTAVMMLIERGLLSLEDKVASLLPRFGQNGKDEVRVIHLLTHTSGLPDMLQGDLDLRRRHRPLSDFIEEIYRLPLRFAPGTQVSYQSMGTAILGELVREISGHALPEFLRREIFTPLGMDDSTLGCDACPRARVATIRVPAELQDADWNWNGAYWHGFGAPWGGLITTPADLAKFCAMMLGRGSLGQSRILSPAGVRAMTSNQLVNFPDLPEAERRCRPWGLGWRLNWPSQPTTLGDLVGARAYGHWGATGTLFWIDPETDVFFILLTTQPLAENRVTMSRVSNAVMAAFVGG